MMAYLVLGHDWGEYNVYHLAEVELQRYARLGQHPLCPGSYLDLTADNLPPEAKRLYTILHREYCLALYGTKCTPTMQRYHDMAQIVYYMENNVEYTEGPFVLVEAGGWRIEVELKGHHCPVLPDISIYKLLEAHRLYSGKSDDQQKVANVVDWLNGQVRLGRIALQGNRWLPCPL